MKKMCVVVCFEREKNCVFVPCGPSCLFAMWMGRNFKIVTVLFVDKFVSQVLQIYFCLTIILSFPPPK